MDNTQTKKAVSAFANAFGKPLYTPILKTPEEYGLDYETVYFSPADNSNIKLEGWLFRSKGSNKIVIANHPMCFSKYGFPGHLKEYPLLPDNEFEVNFIPDYKHLVEAGFNEGVCTAGIDESNDVVASVKYVKSHPELSSMDISLYSRCFGANTTIIALEKYPEVFKDVKALLLLQPVSMRIFFTKALANMGLKDKEHADAFDKEYKEITGYGMDASSPFERAKSITIPTLVIQVHDDVATEPSDVQKIYDNIGAKDKKLFWIEGTTRRFDGYNYLPENPDLLIDWFKSHNN
ncbi:hypothetical protein [Absidia glauca]|uniref:Alpha/beta hydrolase n=1 Tax=Absidia glauca TaxID=4829 RepID=A0A168LBL6_ABSGL|nr:hypothetical protein [Absidia glauca]